MKVNDDEYIKIAIQFAKDTNPIWPFAAIIVNEQGKIICKATDCAHISPIFHAETLAIHALIPWKKQINLGSLALYTTAEPDVMSQSAIHWANLVHDLSIQKVCFGSSLNTIQKLWPFGIDIPAKEVIERSHSKINLIGLINEAECNELFLTAKQEQAKLSKHHPAQGVLSNEVTDFYQLTL